MNKIASLLLLIISFNCSAMNYVKIEKDYAVSYAQNNVIYKDIGSGIQWNNDYMVTAKHVNFVRGSVYECSENCDLRFVKHKKINNNPLPKWRNDRKNEKLNIVGNGGGESTDVVSGILLNLELFVDNGELKKSLPKDGNINSMVKVIRANIIPGQSGGPVYGVDDEVVGMAIGHTVIFDNKGNKEFVSLYIPYKTIKNEWLKFEKNNN